MPEHCLAHSLSTSACPSPALCAAGMYAPGQSQGQACSPAGGRAQSARTPGAGAVELPPGQAAGVDGPGAGAGAVQGARLAVAPQAHPARIVLHDRSRLMQQFHPAGGRANGPTHGQALQAPADAPPELQAPSPGRLGCSQLAAQLEGFAAQLEGFAARPKQLLTLPGVQRPSQWVQGPWLPGGRSCPEQGCMAMVCQMFGRGAGWCAAQVPGWLPRCLARRPSRTRGQLAEDLANLASRASDLPGTDESAPAARWCWARSPQDRPVRLIRGRSPPRCPTPTCLGGLRAAWAPERALPERVRASSMLALRCMLSEAHSSEQSSKNRRPTPWHGGSCWRRCAAWPAGAAAPWSRTLGTVSPAAQPSPPWQAAGAAGCLVHPPILTPTERGSGGTAAARLRPRLAPGRALTRLQGCTAHACALPRSGSPDGPQGRPGRRGRFLRAARPVRLEGGGPL